MPDQPATSPDPATGEPEFNPVSQIVINLSDGRVLCTRPLNVAGIFVDKTGACSIQVEGMNHPTTEDSGTLRMKIFGA